jgi:hypothetical protein
LLSVGAKKETLNLQGISNFHASEVANKFFMLQSFFNLFFILILRKRKRKREPNQVDKNGGKMKNFKNGLHFDSQRTF